MDDEKKSKDYLLEQERSLQSLFNVLIEEIRTLQKSPVPEDSSDQCNGPQEASDAELDIDFSKLEELDDEAEISPKITEGQDLEKNGDEKFKVSVLEEISILKQQNEKLLKMVEEKLSKIEFMGSGGNKQAMKKAERVHGLIMEKLKDIRHERGKQDKKIKKKKKVKKKKRKFSVASSSKNKGDVQKIPKPLSSFELFKLINHKTIVYLSVDSATESGAHLSNVISDALPLPVTGKFSVIGYLDEQNDVLYFVIHKELLFQTTYFDKEKEMFVRTLKENLENAKITKKNRAFVVPGVKFLREVISLEPRPGYPPINMIKYL